MQVQVMVQMTFALIKAICINDALSDCVNCENRSLKIRFTYTYAASEDREERDELLAAWSALNRDAEDEHRDRNDVFETIIHCAEDTGTVVLSEVMQELLVEYVSKG